MAVPLDNSQTPAGILWPMTRTVLFPLALVLALSACTPPEKVDSSTETPAGNQAVYDRLSGLTDCSELQAEFDTATVNGVTDYMEAADARMEAVGCYG